MRSMLNGLRAPGSVLPMCIVLAMLCATAAVVDAQHDGHGPAAKAQRSPEPGAPIPALGWEPIRCWRQISSGAVTIGETFNLVLTCAVYEADNAQVIPDESRLGVASIQLAPFEILGGSHPPDVRRGSRRFFQYSYQLRVIGPDAIGHDTNIPPLTISYRIQSRVGAAATLEGRDLSYLLPMMPIKVLSLVPADAVDIRDASDAGLAAVDALRFRSSVFNVLAITFGALAAVMAVLALIPLARPSSATGAAREPGAPDRAILLSAAAGLEDVQTQARGGWTDDLLARALSLMRIVAAAAIDQRITQKPWPANGATAEGRLVVRHGAIRPVSAAVSSAVTADDLGRAVSSPAKTLPTTRQQQVEALQHGLSALTVALYSREPSRDSASIDEAVLHARNVAQEIAAERSWIRQWVRR